MDFTLSTEHEILRNSVRDFAENEIRPIAGELDEREEFSYETMKAMADLGLFGMFVPEEYGGQGMDYIGYIIATEEIARVDGSHAATVAAGNSLGLGPLYYYGNEEQKRKYLPPACRGETL
jgi:short-chain 2-methylacyl-CoA dehydrogenase